MNWKGNELKSINDLMTLGIDKCDTKEEARQFILEYVKENIHARSNIGYLAGYYSQEDQQRIFDWFDVVHPIFGTTNMQPEDLIRLGMEMGERQVHKTSVSVMEQRLQESINDGKETH